MTGKTDNLLPDAQDVQRQAAARDSKKADDYVRLLAEAELEKRALTERPGAASAMGGQHFRASDLAGGLQGR